MRSDAAQAAFHRRAGGENGVMDRAPIGTAAVAFLVVALFVCAVVSGAALRAALG